MKATARTGRRLRRAGEAARRRRTVRRGMSGRSPPGVAESWHRSPSVPKRKTADASVATHDRRDRHAPRARPVPLDHPFGGKVAVISARQTAAESQLMQQFRPRSHRRRAAAGLDARSCPRPASPAGSARPHRDQGSRCGAKAVRTRRGRKESPNHIASDAVSTATIPSACSAIAANTRGEMNRAVIVLARPQTQRRLTPRLRIDGLRKRRRRRAVSSGRGAAARSSCARSSGRGPW